MNVHLCRPMCRHFLCPGRMLTPGNYQLRVVKPLGNGAPARWPCTSTGHAHQFEIRECRDGAAPIRHIVLPREPGGFMSSFSRRRRLAACAAILAAALTLAACGAKTNSASSSSSTGGGEAVDTSGPTIKVGLLNSLSGT